MSVVATLGVGEFLLLFAVVLNRETGAASSFPQPPWFPEFDVGALRVTRSYSAMLFLAPIVVTALALFLRRGRFGRAMRAAAGNPEAARLSGVYAGRMSSLAWGLAGGLSALTAILVIPTRGFVAAASFGPSLLLRALAAAVVARMTSLPIALAAGIAIGVLEQQVLWNWPGSGLLDLVLFVVILAGLLLARRRGSREADGDDWTSVRPWPPLTEEQRQVWLVRNLGRVGAVTALIVALIVLPFLTNRAAYTLVGIMAFAVVGLAVGLLAGLGGQLSLGMFAFAGIGATISYQVTQRTGNFLLGLLLAALGAAAAAVIVGLPALRIRGLMLAVTTLAFALACQAWLLRQSWALGDGVDPGRPIVGSIALDDGKQYFFFALAVLALSTWVTANIWRAGLGRRLVAVRDNEDNARAFAISATAVKLQGFILAGAVAGLGGAVYGHSLPRINADTFPVDASIDAVALTVIGGIGVLAGPLVGAFYTIGVPGYLPLDNAGLAATSMGWLLLIMYAPGGVAQIVAPVRGRLLDLLVARSGLRPSTAGEGVEGGESGAAMSLESLVVERRPSPERSLPLLVLEDVRKEYGGIEAVAGVALTVEAGEIVGLIGANGAGKTTLFELIGGFATADRGRIVFDGRDVTHTAPENRARAGLVRSFQDAALFPTLTVLETVRLSLERTTPTRLGPALVGARGAERRRTERAVEIVSLMGLDPWRDAQVGELSTGTRRIAELACMVALEPTLLLLDEPSSGIAQRETEALAGVLTGFRDTLGMTLFVIEHDIPLVTSISDRLVAMDTGSVISEGLPDDVRNDPVVVDSYLGNKTVAIERSGKVDG